MRPVKNESHGYCQPSDSWNGLEIKALVPCVNTESCRNHYKNFEIACGGYERIVEGIGFPKCVFFVVAEGYLSDNHRGQPLL